MFLFTRKTFRFNLRYDKSSYPYCSTSVRRK